MNDLCVKICCNLEYSGFQLTNNRKECLSCSSLTGDSLTAFCKLLEDEYIRRSNLKPLIWDNTIHLPLDEVYTRLEVKWRRKGTFQLTDKEIHMYEIFNLGERDGNSGWFQRLLDMFGKGTQEKARMVLVEGSPGIGKTTFCLKIANDWARKAIPKKHDFPVFQLMFLLKCRDMDGDVMQAIDDQLLPEDMTEEKKEDIMAYIRDDKNQAQILIILDGLDELPKLAEQFVDKLLRRKVLSHCSILATSRQEKGIEVRKGYDFDSLLQINGFTIEDACQYIRKHFKNVDSEDLLKGESLIQVINENIFLHALRNNPLNLLLLCVVYEDFEGDLPSNRSELYQVIFRCLLRRFCSKNNLEVYHDDRALENQFEASTLALGELAWRCLVEDRPSFLEEELDKLEKLKTSGRGFPTVKLGVVFMEASVKKLNPRHQFHFLHKTFQEFLAAVYLARKMLKEGINVFDYFQLDNRGITRKYRQVLLFVAGILGKDGAVFFEQVGEFLNRNWNWQSPEEEDCVFLTELLNESGAADELAMVVWRCIPLPESLELSLRDVRTLRFVRYAHEACSSLERNLAPAHLTKLMLTEAHTLAEDRASDVRRILNNKALKDLFISTDKVTSLLASTLKKGLSASHLSLSSFTLKVFESIDIAVNFGRSLSSCSSLTTVKMLKEGIDVFDYFQLDNRGITRKYRQVFLFVAGILGKDGAVFFKQVGELLNRDWNWQSPEEEDCVFLMELLKESGAADELATVVWRCIPLPESLELSLRDGHTLRFVRYAHEACSSLERNHLTKLMLTEAHTLTEDRASEVRRILNNKALRDLFISTDKVTSLLASTLKKGLSASNMSLSSFTLEVFESIPPDIAVTFGRGLACCYSLTTVRLKLMNESKDGWARAVNIGLSASIQLKSVILEFYGTLSDTVGQSLKLLLSNKSLISFSLIGNVEDCLASALSEGLLGDTALESLTVIAHGSLSNLGAESLVKGFQENRTLHSLMFKVFGDVPEHWIAMVDKIYVLAENNSWKSLVLHPNVQGKFANVSAPLLNPISNDNVLKKTLAINIWGELSTYNTEAIGGHLLKISPLSSLTLNVHGKVSDGVADCLVKFFVANNVLFTLTINLWGETSSYGRTALQRLREEGLMQSFILNVHGLVTEGFECFPPGNICPTSTTHSDNIGSTTRDELSELFSESKSLNELNLTVQSCDDKRGDWGKDLGDGLAENKSLTTFSLTVHNYAGTEVEWGYLLGDGLAQNTSLTTFSLTVHNYAGTRGGWGYGLGNGLAQNTSLTTFSLTVHNYADTGGEGWGYHLGNSLAQNTSLTTFSLTVHNYAGTRVVWGYGLGNGLAKNRSLTTFTLTVHNYAGTGGEGWGYGLGHGLALNKSLTSFSLTVRNYADTRGVWGYGLGKGLAKNRSLTTFSLTVHNYADTGGGWGYHLGNSLAQNTSLTTFSLTVHDYAGTRGNWGYSLGNGLAQNRSLTTFSLTVHDYAEAGVEWGHGLAEGLVQSSSLATLRLSFNTHSGIRRDGEYELLQRLAEIKTLTSLSVSLSLYGEDKVF